MAANARTRDKRSPLFLLEAIVVLALVGLLAIKAPTWAGALSSYTAESSYDFSEAR
jgi:hypothetical protein